MKQCPADNEIESENMIYLAIAIRKKDFEGKSDKVVLIFITS